ncbi:uncharacterized protein LOC118647803 [Monomorium pharaonis]|uniref:uncharacterized protein LOC118647803 n=1 Tax=Monomorium pharaonis TaxID=307658 RepID=UPI001745E99C|nr:uncharacterized protein LOC118647803 [Monomorium pharaonis]
MFIFPRVRYTQIFLRNGPPDCIGAGNHSGWMQKKEFLIFLAHFIHHAKPTKEEPVLLMLDNHSSHINIEVVNKAKNNNIILFSFPPHCSYRLQPLDVGVYGPFKNYMSRYQTAWMHNNPGKTMTIYDLPGIVKDSLPLALNPSNIMSGFRKSGIWPLNKDIFQKHDFAPSFVTDRLNLISNNDEPTAGTSGMSVENEEDDITSDVSLNLENPEVLKSAPVLDISVTEIINEMTHDDLVAGPSGIQNVKDFSPEKIRPLPKAPPRKSSIRRRTRKSAILTDTPEKNALEEEYHEREKKKTMTLKRREKENRKVQWKGKGPGKRKKKVEEKVEKVKRKVFNKNEWFCIMCEKAYAPSEEWVQCILCKQ